MGNANSIFYLELLHLFRGEDAWLYDSTKKKY